MTATTHHPVDSTTRTCCSGIGTHTPDCPEVELLAPPFDGAQVEDWRKCEWIPAVYRTLRRFTGHIHRSAFDGAAEEPVEVYISGTQAEDGEIAESEIWVAGNIALTSEQARLLAADLLAVADEQDQLDA